MFFLHYIKPERSVKSDRFSVFKEHPATSVLDVKKKTFLINKFATFLLFFYSESHQVAELNFLQMIEL